MNRAEQISTLLGEVKPFSDAAILTQKDTTKYTGKEVTAGDMKKGGYFLVKGDKNSVTVSLGKDGVESKWTWDGKGYSKSGNYIRKI